jgi:hypothetical protein
MSNISWLEAQVVGFACSGKGWRGVVVPCNEPKQSVEGTIEVNAAEWLFRHAKER